MVIELDMYQACALGALVYCLGRMMVKKLPVLGKYCIPAPVAGGIVFAFAHLAFYMTGVLELSFDTTLQTVFMTIFFCSVGFTACRCLFFWRWPLESVSSRILSAVFWHRCFI